MSTFDGTRLVVDITTIVLYIDITTSRELRRWLARRGCTFEPGHGGHLRVRRGDRFSVLPMHGNESELPTFLVAKIKKQLGLG